MGQETGIEWTDHTFNPWIGCTKVAPGCTHCYAESFAKRYGKAQWGPSGTRVKTSANYWRQPIKWNREAAADGVRRRVFCASLADVFEDWRGPIHGSGVDDDTLAIDDNRSRLLTMDDVRRELFALIEKTPHLDWLLLTKRPENIPAMWAAMSPNRDPAIQPNVWLGTSASEQETWDRNVHYLYHGCRKLSPVLFVSLEPLLGPVKCHHEYDGNKVRNWFGDPPGIDWVIVGGESGHVARPMHPQWASDLRDQCIQSRVAFHFKQWGEWLPFDDVFKIPGDLDAMPVCLVKHDGRVFRPYSHAEHAPGAQMVKVGKKAAGRELDGRTWDEFPQPLIREPRP